MRVWQPIADTSFMPLLLLFRRLVTCALSLVFVATLPHAHARGVLYRCIDPFGQVSIQSGKCPKGTKQDKVVSESAPSSPSPIIPYAPPVLSAHPKPEPAAISSPNPDAAPKPDDDAASPLPPPPLYQCLTYDNDSYYTEDPEPKERCVGLQTIGIDGSTAMAAGQSCEVKIDRCQRVGDKAACDAWKMHSRQLQAAWKFGPSEKANANRSEFERVQKIVTETSCGLPQP